MVAYEVLTIIGYVTAIAVTVWNLWVTHGKATKDLNWFKEQYAAQSEQLQAANQQMVQACGGFYSEAKSISQQNNLDNLGLTQQRAAINTEKLNLQGLMQDAFPDTGSTEMPVQSTGALGGLSQDQYDKVMTQLKSGEMPEDQLNKLGDLLPDSIRAQFPQFAGRDMADTMLAGDNG